MHYTKVIAKTVRDAVLHGVTQDIHEVKFDAGEILKALLLDFANVTAYQ